MTTEELAGGYFWMEGGDNRTKDKVSGVWIRAYSNGKIIGEYSNPTTVAKKKDWKE